MQILKRLAFASLASLAGVATFMATPSAQAQNAAKYPWKPITMVMPYTPGSTSDHEARVYQDNLPEIFKGMTFLIDYKPGASGMIANSFVAKQAPDGHTFAYVPATVAILPAIRKDIPYDYLKDLAPVIQTTRRVFVLAVHPSFPASNLKEYIAHARANPGKVTWSTVGAGGALHMSGEWLASLANIKLTFVHYKGAAAAELDLIAGRIDSSPKGMVSALPQMKNGKLRSIGIITNERTPIAPDLRTVEEEGPAFAGYNYPSWVGIVTTGATPRDIVDKLYQGLNKAIRLPKAMAVWESQGTVPVGLNPDEFRKRLMYEEGIWRKLVKEQNIVAE